MRYLMNVLDILFVAYIFYRLLLLIKGTRAVQVVLGILTLVAITFVSQEVFHFTALTWLLQKFWIGGMVILVVVFQPEIRGALAQLGSHKWSRFLITSELNFIDEIVQAIKICSEKQVGALIAIEQETGLKTYIETGVGINSKVTKELLISIFTPPSPLHDGAVVVSNARIAAASCLFPLSHEPIVSQLLGTRHRAAIGLSEITDAFIIVVSEESGKISLAKKGRLESDVEPAEIHKQLMDIFRKTEKVIF